MKKIAKILVFVMMLLMILPMAVSAIVPYETYTYDIDGFSVPSPHAYVPEVYVNSAYITALMPEGTTDAEKTENKKYKESLKLETPTDVEADENGNVYVTDKDKNRVLILDDEYRFKHEITSFVNFSGVLDSFNKPSSTFIVNDGDYKGLYVCDTGNDRILVFDLDTYDIIREINKPKSTLLVDDGYSPKSCVVDKYGRLYVAASARYEGVMVMTIDGKLINFIGAPKVSVSAADALKNMLSSAAENLNTNISTTFDSLDLDYTSQEFVYATCTYPADERDNQMQAMMSNDATYSPTRLLNAKGKDIMSRNGFFLPAGEVALFMAGIETDEDTPKGASNIVDITSGPNGIWSIIDNARCKVYTYDYDGNLLYVFGDKGDQLGNMNLATSITYQGDKILVLDGQMDAFTVYRKTEYARLLDEAIELQNLGEYDAAVAKWEAVLARNNNFDTAYVAIGKAYHRSGEYSTAIKYFQNAFDTENYALAFKEVRKEAMEIWFIPIIVLVVVFFILLGKAFGWVGKVNKAATFKSGRRTLKEELCYGMHVMFHPFDGYWDLKHEQRGSVRSAIIYLAVTVLAFYYQSMGTGYYLNPQGFYNTIFGVAASILLPLLLFVLGNWCFTTLFDGEGSMKMIFISVSYALFPMPFLVVISTILTNVLVGDEATIATMLVTIGYIWMAFLIIFGMQVIHSFSAGKNVVMILCTLVGMLFIVFVALLFTTLTTKMIGFVTSIVEEISFR